MTTDTTAICGHGHERDCLECRKEAGTYKPQKGRQFLAECVNGCGAKIRLPKRTIARCDNGYGLQCVDYECGMPLVVEEKFYDENPELRRA